MAVRPARPADVPAILGLVRELADYERALAEVQATEEQLLEALFADVPAVFALVAERDQIEPDEAEPDETKPGEAEPGEAEPDAAEPDGAEPDGADPENKVVGFALWFLNFSTWLGRHGVYLEDLYVRPDARGQGHGRALLAELARVCVERGYGRLEWWVLDWNEPARSFYRSLAAVPMDEWTVHRLTGEPLRRLAAHGSEIADPIAPRR